MSDDSVRALSSDEQRYLDHLRSHLTDLPRSPRNALLIAAEQNLAERPMTGGWQDLLDQLGQPHDYAAVLRNDLEVAAPGALERARRRRRFTRGLTACVVVILIGTAVTGVWRWMTWRADFGANTSAVCVGSNYPEDCNQTDVIDRSNVFGDVKEVPCVPGTEVIVVNGLVARDAVTVTGVDLDGIEGIYRLDRVVPWPERRGSDNVLDNPSASSWPLDVGPESGETLLHFHFRLECSPTRMVHGSSVIIEAFTVRYHAWGKDRAVTMPFLQSLQITRPEGS